MSETINGVTLSKPLCKYIDHTILKADASEDQVRAICQEALQYDFASVCVNASYVPLVSGLLKGSQVKTCCVIGFPLGAMTSEAKAAETMDAVAKGAEEVDMVIHVGMVKSENWDAVQKDIAAVNAAKGNARLKVIIETCLLTDGEKARVCEIAKGVGADYVKTSTGFSTGGATAEDVSLMRKTVGPDVGVKASGGIRDLKACLAMIEAGASRIGTSAGIAIMEQAK